MPDDAQLITRRGAAGRAAPPLHTVAGVGPVQSTMWITSLG